MDHQRYDNELKRTAVQKKAVTRMSPEDVLKLATLFFREHGYKAALTGRPNQMFVMGGREGELPRVTGEVAARLDVGKKGTTLVTLDAAGERLGPTMQAFLDLLRAESRKLREQENR